MHHGLGPTSVSLSIVVLVVTQPAIPSSSLQCAKLQFLVNVLGILLISFIIPRVSTNGSEGEKCPLDTNYIVADLCDYVNQQTLKLQECPEDIPTGEMPRHIVCMMERNLVDRIAPGTRCSIIGYIDTFDQAKQVLIMRMIYS